MYIVRGFRLSKSSTVIVHIIHFCNETTSFRLGLVDFLRLGGVYLPFYALIVFANSSKANTSSGIRGAVRVHMHAFSLNWRAFVTCHKSLRMGSNL